METSQRCMAFYTKHKCTSRIRSRLAGPTSMHCGGDFFPYNISLLRASTIENIESLCVCTRKWKGRNKLSYRK